MSSEVISAVPRWPGRWGEDSDPDLVVMWFGLSGHTRKSFTRRLCDLGASVVGC